MSMENVERYRQAVKAYNRGDLDQFLALMDSDVEWVARLSGVEGRVRGIEGVRSWWNDQFAAFDELRLELPKVVGGGDWVVAGGTSYMRGGQSGVALSVPFGHATLWENGRITRFESFETFEEALEAAGLSE
jgi:ketosteroid isomerase-like protein